MMIKNDNQFWSLLLKKTGLVPPTPEEADAELEMAEATTVTMMGFDSVMPALSQAKPAAMLESLFEKLQDLVCQIGDVDVAAAADAIGEFLSFISRNQDGLFAFLHERLRQPISIEDKRALQRHLHPLGPDANVAAYYKQEDALDPGEIRTWLEDDSTDISALVSTPHRRIFLALVEPSKIVPPRRFTAFWLWLAESCHVVVVSKTVSGANGRARRLVHELDHVADFLKASRGADRKEERPMGVADLIRQDDLPQQGALEAGGKEDAQESFASKQKRRDASNKQLVAKWVTSELPLQDGAGVIIDAGSSCLQVWSAILDQVEANKFSFLTVHTNNLLVLEEWRIRYNSPGVRQTNLELTGRKVDWDHLALYEGEEHQRVANPNFRPMNVYIGTSGIEFDEKGKRIFLGYHGPEPERKVKEFLFQCHCRRRVILVTPRKIGFAGGPVYDVLSIENLNTNAPIYLVTTNPEKDSDEEKQFQQAKDTFQSEAMESALADKGLVFHWITIDSDSRAGPKLLEHLVVPKSPNAEIV